MAQYPSIKLLQVLIAQLIKHPQTKGTGEIVLKMFSNHIQDLTTQKDDESWKIDPQHIKIHPIELGRGGYGVVNEGTYRGNRIAIKSLHQFLCSAQYYIDEFQKEAKEVDR